MNGLHEGLSHFTAVEHVPPPVPDGIERLGQIVLHEEIAHGQGIPIGTEKGLHRGGETPEVLLMLQGQVQVVDLAQEVQEQQVKLLAQTIQLGLLFQYMKEGTSYE